MPHRGGRRSAPGRQWVAKQSAPMRQAYIDTSIRRLDQALARGEVYNPEGRQRTRADRRPEIARDAAIRVRIIVSLDRFLKGDWASEPYADSSSLSLESNEDSEPEGLEASTITLTTPCALSSVSARPSVSTLSTTSCTSSLYPPSKGVSLVHPLP